MKIVNQSVELLQITTNAEKFIERCGRVCYKSEDKITENSSVNFIKHIINNGHESVLEHAIATFKIITDRGISHEIVRHRIASYSQESTRYCAYNNEIEVIKPYKIEEDLSAFNIWVDNIKLIEEDYKQLLKIGMSPQNARDILPTCLKTEIIMTANFREWRHFIKLRRSKSAHPKIRELSKMILDELLKHAPNIFSDL